MNKLEACDLILKELNRAETKHPYWPTDAIHAAGILGEESGELMQAALQWNYEEVDQNNLDHMIKEAAQTGAMAIRFLMQIHLLKRNNTMQHLTE